MSLQPWILWGHNPRYTTSSSSNGSRPIELIECRLGMTATWNKFHLFHRTQRKSWWYNGKEFILWLPINILRVWIEWPRRFVSANRCGRRASLFGEEFVWKGTARNLRVAKRELSARLGPALHFTVLIFLRISWFWRVEWVFQRLSIEVVRTKLSGRWTA